MKKFKHKVTGIIGEVKDDNWLHFERCSGNVCSQEGISMDLVKWSEDWDEIVEKEYEILSFIANTPIGDIKKGTIVKRKGTDLCCYRQPRLLNIRAEESSLLENTKWDIHSVKRLSDGEVFTVDDRCVTISNNDYGKITRFYLSRGEVFTNSTNYPNSPTCKLCDLVTIKKPLFTTEDGVDIFEGDKYYWVFDKVWANIKPFTIKRCTASELLEGESFDTPVKKFSTKEAADEYVIQNRVVFTTEDGVDMFKGDNYVALTRDTLTFKEWYVKSSKNNIQDKKVFTVTTSAPSGLKHCLLFSTKEAAEEYILMNKPLGLSINDIVHFKGSKDSTFMKTYLKDLVKSKL